MLRRDNLQRRVHVELSSQQRRLRHVTSISARNITPRNNLSNLNNLGTYFTLHLHKDDEEFYKSEVTRSFNPTWQSFDTRQISADFNTSSTSFIIRIWGGENARFILLIEWTVDLHGLVYSGDRIKQDDNSYEPNYIIIGLQDGYYVAPRKPQTDSGSNEKNNQSLLKVDQELVRSSYNLSSVHRLQTLVRAIRQTQLQINNVKHHIQKHLHITKDHLTQSCECNSLRLNVKILKEELEKHKEILKSERDKETGLRQSVKLKGEDFLKNRDAFEEARTEFNEARTCYSEKRETLIKTNIQLLTRRKQLCHELAYIYPIEQLPDKETVVCGLSLPITQSPEFNGTNEETLSSAFGYVCHMVTMISKIFQVPLRYPTKLRGSRSSIFDHVNDKLPEKEREFPLFIKGKERSQFEFAVFLLNKDIAQIRFCLGLATSDLRLTLPNMKTLFDTKFGGSSPYLFSPISRSLSPMNVGNKNNDKSRVVKDDEKESITNESSSKDHESDVYHQESQDTDELSLGVIKSDQEYKVCRESTNNDDLPVTQQTTKHKFLSGDNKNNLAIELSTSMRTEKSPNPPY